MITTLVSRIFPPLSFRKKTILAVVFTSTLAVLLACGTFMAYERLTFVDGVRESLEAHARVLAHNCVVPMEFGDSEAARELLEGSLAVESAVEGAWILTPEGEVFAEYTRPGATDVPAPTGALKVWAEGQLAFVTPLVSEGRPMGALALLGNLSDLKARLWGFALLALGVLVGCLTLSWSIAYQLQDTIVTPVLSLAEVAALVSRERNYGLRAPRTSRDEIGALTDAFNQMLEEIERNQAELQGYSEDLHRRVEERTRALAAAKAQAEEAARSLLRSERRFRSLSACAPIGILELKGEGALTYANPHLSSILGQPFQTLLGEGWQRALCLAPDAPQPWLGVIKARQPFDGELQVKISGMVRWVHLIVMPMGAEEGMVGTLEDITARKLAEIEREALAQERERLSREAGMASVATNVLHNVGNVLNSVNVSAQVAADRLADSSLQELVTLSQLLAARAGDLQRFLAEDPIGQALPELLSTLAEVMGQDQTDIAAELASLSKNIEHIKVIVQMQQSFARAPTLPERIEVDALVSDAIALGMAGLERHGISIKTELAPLPPITVDKHRGLEILINLLSNAKHAIQEHTGRARMITVRTAAAPEGGVQITVEDTGMGIDPEHLQRIFSHGFTTRREGHGFGLHSAANGAQTLGGELKAHSEGLGRGAAFTLTLPVAPKRELSPPDTPAPPHRGRPHPTSAQTQEHP